MSKNLLIYFCLALMFYHQSQAQSISFKKEKNMPKGGFGMFAESSESKLYLFGGYIRNEMERNSLFLYDTVVGDWIDLSETFEYFVDGGISSVIALQDHKHLLIQGSAIIYDTIDTYTFLYNTETLKASPFLVTPSKNLFQSTVSHNGLVYFFGGHQPIGNSQRFESSSSSFYSLDPATHKFAQLEDMPFKGVTDGVMINNKLFTIGGVETVKVKSETYQLDYVWSPSIYSFDFKTKKWDLTMDLDIAPINPKVAAYKSFIFILEDTEDENTLTVVDTASKTHQKYELDLKIYQKTMEVLGDRLHLVGGLTSNDYATTKHFSVSCKELIAKFRNDIE